MPQTADIPSLAPEALQRCLGQAFSQQLQVQGCLLQVKDLPTGRWLYANQAMADFLKAAPQDLIGCTDGDVLESSLAGLMRAAEQAAVAQAEPLYSDHAFEWRGLRREFSVGRTVLHDPGSGTGSVLVAVWRDLADQRKQEAQLRQALVQIEQQQQTNEALRREIADQALRDPSSGLYRRAHFDDQLRREVDLSTREHREFSVVFVELDTGVAQSQTAVADAHQRVLQALGLQLRSGTRAMDASCRYDDRRFAVLLSGVGLATAHARMESLRRKCAAQIVVHEGREMGFTVSVGVASYPHTAQSQDALLAACEAALQEAQRRGGNHVALAAISFERRAAPGA